MEEDSRVVILEGKFVLFGPFVNKKMKQSEHKTYLQILKKTAKRRGLCSKLRPRVGDQSPAQNLKTSQGETYFCSNITCWNLLENRFGNIQ